MLDRCLELRIDTLVGGERGSGKTHLLRELADRHRPGAVFVSCRFEDDLRATIDHLLTAVRREPVALRTGGDGAVVEAAINVLADSEIQAVMVDDLAPRPAKLLFGAFRDELVRSGLTWIVAVDTTTRSAIDDSVAATFFQRRVSIPELDEQDYRDIVDEWLRRSEEEVPAGLLLDVLLRLRPTTPLVANIAMANLLTEPDPIAAAHELLERQRRADDLPDAHREVLAALGTSASSASSPELQQRTGLGRSRIGQILRELEERGFVEGSRDGRKRLYRAQR